MKALICSMAANLRGVGAKLLSVLLSIGLLIFGLVLSSPLAEGLVFMFHPMPLMNPREEKLALLTQADIYVQPSVSEGGCLVV